MIMPVKNAFLCLLLVLEAVNQTLASPEDCDAPLLRSLGSIQEMTRQNNQSSIHM